jgi:hypothetical protein
MTCIRGIIFASLLANEITIDIGAFNPLIPGYGLVVVHRSKIAPDAQMPNSLVWVHLNENMEIVAVTRCG